MPDRICFATMEEVAETPFLRNSPPWKGTEMLSRLVKLQLKAAALRDDRGATAVEYGLMVALIAIVIIVAVTLLGTNLNSLFGRVASSV
ncbi:MAG: Flp family type IVb pilin [Cypionkella sp.]